MMMMRYVKFLIFFLCGLSFKTYAQTITIGAVNEGPYGRGSSIAIPLTIDDAEGKLLSNNVFKLYLSDANGDFGAEREIGSYSGFYTTFVNGIIPSAAIAGNYRVRVKSTNPAVTSQPSASIQVSAVAGLTAAIDAPTQTISTNPKTFGNCAAGRNNQRFNFVNASTAGASVTATFTNGFNATDIKQVAFESPTAQFIAEITHYTILVKAEANGVIATQSYFLINNTQNTPFSTFGSNTVCLPKGLLQYGVEISSASGIQSNFPGYSYRVNWGDQGIETYTLNQIKANGGVVQHTYFKSSCGSQVVIGSVRYYNVFGIGMQLMSPFCNEIGTPVSTQAKVVTQPENRFGIPGVACLNTPLTITNTSITGENPSSTAPECNNNDVVYYWYIDDVLVTPNGVPLTYQLKHTFTTPGQHKIRLESESSSECQAAPIERKIQIQIPPKPSFILDADKFCLTSTAKTTNTSEVDNANGGQNQYEWVISGPAAPVFVNGTSASSEHAEFKFTQPGIYKVKLVVKSSCEPASSPEQTITVNDVPKITANWQTNICGKGQLLTFSNTQGNPVTTSFSGTFKEEADSYTWEIAGEGYSFKEGTNSHSKEPVIFFEEYGTYDIKITAKNNCGTTVITKTITFSESPTVNAGADMTICAGSSAPLKGAITGPPVSGFTWVGGTGTFVGGRNSLTTEYLPSAAEIKAGEVQLSLSATTLIPAPCDKVADVVVIKINPPNKITSAASATICTGSEILYQPEAVITGSTITWTATGSANASGFAPSGTGEIKAILTNTSNATNATVTYTIVPEANGCPGEPFTYKITITPLPGVQASVANKTICTGQLTDINLIPTLSNTLYTWTSTVTGAVTGNSQQATPANITAIKEKLTNTGTTTGSVTYVITPVNSTSCPGQQTTVTINVTAPPVKADAGADQKLCSVNSAQLNANHPGNGTGKWTLASNQTGITFSDNTKFDATVEGLIPGQVYRFKWTITGPGTCNSTTDEVVVNNLSPLGNNTINYSGYTVCEGSTVTVTGSTPTGGDGEYSYVWESSTDGNTWVTINIIGQKSLNVMVTEDTFLRRKINSGSCSSLSGIVKIDVQRGISNNTITGNQHICTNVIPSKLEGSIPVGADGEYKYQWQQSTDGTKWSVILSATDKDYQPNALSQTTLFRRVVTSVICSGDQQSISASIEVRVSPGALASFAWTSESACSPFIISPQNIKARASEAGDTYEWFANDKSIGTGIDFPGYTIQNSGDTVEVKLVVTSGLGCGKREFSHKFKTNSTITADFTADNLQGCGTVSVNFTNKTLNPEGVNFEWNFGNGITSNVGQPSAVTFYAREDGKDTIYVVTLKAISACASSNKTLSIKVVGKPTPRFSPSIVEGCSPLKVTFKNLSPGLANTYTWNFGDGTANEVYTDNRSVAHTFYTGKARTFTVTMTLKNACGEKSLSHTIRVSPNTVQPDLVVNPAQLAGCAPHTVKFHNYTTGATHYTYIFDDGTDTIRTNSDDPIEHTFTKGGDYYVKLIASNCSDTVVVKKITVYHQAGTAFTADQTEGCAPLTVKFTNTTTKAISYLWDFGDGTTSTAVNPPAHIYSAKKSTYTVKLITKSTYGCMDTLVMKDYIKVGVPPTPSFEVLPGDVIQYPDFRFTFKNTSTGEVDKLTWDFGDRSPLSNQNNPEHSYPDTGVYKVRLTVTSKLGCSDFVERTVRITGTPGQLFIPNAFMPNSASEELRSFKAKGSGIAKWHFRIFNKWGEVLWQTDKLDAKGAPTETWDGNLNGRPVPQGVYFWEINATFKNGTEWAGMSYNNKEPKKTGAIHLIR